MNCVWFEDRLYDEDSRQAQRDAGRVPEDLAGHLETCVSCQQAYDRAAKDEINFARRLRQAPSAESRARILDRIRDAESCRLAVWTRWFPMVSDALTAGAVAVALSNALLEPQTSAWRVAVFTVGGSLSLLGPRLKGLPQQLERSLRLLLAPY